MDLGLQYISESTLWPRLHLLILLMKMLLHLRMRMSF